jgi:polysaccharide export outer membrane protein
MLAIRSLAVASIVVLVTAGVGQAQPISGARAPVPAIVTEQPDYLIGVGDMLHVFVWKNPELSTDVPVRPDGKITTPLVQNVVAQGKTASQLSADLREALSRYVQDPNITVVIKAFAAPSNAAAIRVIGAAVTPKTVPYRAGLTLLDVMIEVGGLNTFASGNRAVLIRQDNGAYHEYPVRLADLLERGNLKANQTLMPGDVVRIPERWF